MKNEIARREIESLDYYLQNHTNDYSEESHTAMMMAIKALEQEPCEDAISRQELLEDLYKRDYTKFTHRDFVALVQYQDTVQQEPKTGHWIYEKRKRLINETDEGAEYITDYWCKCSKCGGDFGYRKMKDAFCKYCGAKMVEPQESEDKE